MKTSHLGFWLGLLLGLEAGAEIAGEVGSPALPPNEELSTEAPLTAAIAAKLPSRPEIKRIEVIAERVLESYEIGTTGTTKLKADLTEFSTEAQKLGIFPKVENTPESLEFQKHWEINLARFTAPSTTSLMKNIPVNQVAMAIFAATLADMATARDMRDPRTPELRRQGLPTAGDEYFVNKIESAERGRLSTTLLVSAGIGMAVVAAKLKDIFFFGTGSQLTNTVAEPFIRPIRERLDQIVNTRLAPRLVPWAKFVTGEKGRQKKALAAAKSGEVLTNGAERYSHPSMSVAGFIQDHQDFFSEVMKADAKNKGWMSAEFARARQVGFELIYNNPKYLNEQLNTFSTAISTTRLVQKQISIPALISAGATAAEIDMLSDLIQRQQYLLVFEDVRSPGALALNDPMLTLVKKWTARGIPPRVINAFYEGELQLVMASNRAAFSLASFLDTERYFQEYNLALGNMPKLQSWQEQGKEMSGIYNAMREHRFKIEAFFAKKGIKFDVMARINERGFPLGGPTRPTDIAPVTDAILDYTESFPHQSAPAPLLGDVLRALPRAEPSRAHLCSVFWTQFTRPGG